ncbi:addiction module toxin RelE [Pseudoduganella eburnea]|uniref:Addiction module toxin RelE n=1 Tax=Massilia eburnea TaxID=1776165 RepID=A0A6L6QIE5_9BURK|nr:transposase [Massilia eburnea]MTW12019.1 addiction module toxin RelE [Massilia eburnea]
MNRPLRIEHDNAVYHVTSRGDRRCTIFRTDSDRLTWLSILGEVCERFDFVVLAYCQMGNHYHLLVQTRQGQLSRGMRYLNGNYSQYFNRQHGLVGHVFQGRYHAVLCQAEQYLMEITRYTVLNPVRAELVAHPGHWVWSSYGILVGTVDAPVWHERDTVLARFGNPRDTAIEAFEAFVLEGIGKESPFHAVRNQLFLGDDAFCERAAAREFHGDMLEIKRTQRRAIMRPLAEYFELYPEEHEAMAQAYLSHAYTMAEIAEFRQVSTRTVSRAVKFHLEMSDCQS